MNKYKTILFTYIPIVIIIILTLIPIYLMVKIAFADPGTFLNGCNRCHSKITSINTYDINNIQLSFN